MKNLTKALFLSLLTIGIVSCSSDDDNGSSSSKFTIEGTEYDMGSIEPNGGIIQIISGFEDSNSAQISVTGINDSKSGTVRFVLNFDPAVGITGTYADGDILDEVGVFDTDAAMYMTQEIIDGSQHIESSEGGEGTFKITHNSGANYTIEFNVTYDDGVVASGTITQDFVVQEI